MVPSNAAGSRAHPSHVLDFELFQELRESLGNELEIVAGLYRRFLTHTAKTLAELREQPASGTSRNAACIEGQRCHGRGQPHCGHRGTAAGIPNARSDHARGLRLDALEGALAEFRLALSAHLRIAGISPDLTRIRRGPIWD